MHTLVALDLETTGLDPERDAIIEIGAVRFRGPRVEDTWSTLVNPGRPIPKFVSELTHIDDSMVAQAPRLAEVLGTLANFVGDLPALGHNVAFDLSFLKRRGVLEFNQALDTLDLASVILPTSPRYGLAWLAADMGIPVAAAHRALDDAHTTRQVYQKLFDLVLQLPLPVIEEITRLGAEIDWGAGWIFDEAHRQLAAEGLLPSPLQQALVYPFQPPDDSAEPLRPIPEAAPLDPDEVAAVLEPGGPFARRFPDYEHRTQQISMLRAVCQALSEGKHLLVEAGTGTGKSMAYLVPAFAWAIQNGRRVVISTNTINLQDQLMKKDIPDLRRALGTDLRAAVLKGRANYVCPRRIDAMRHLGPRTAEEMRVLAKTLVWLAGGGSGDRGDINLLGPAEAAAWSRLSAESDDCSPEQCRAHTGGACPYYRARAEAENAHLVIVNHALLLADIATGSRVIPEYRQLIIDEAHHLESATTNGLSFSVNEIEMTRLFKDLGNRSGGLISQVISVARRRLPPDKSVAIEHAALDILARLGDCVELSSRLFRAVAEFAENRREGRPLGNYDQDERIVSSTRTLPDWGQVEMAWDELRQPFMAVIQTLAALGDTLPDLQDAGLSDAEELATTLRSSGRGLSEVFANLERMIFEPDNHTIYWAEVQAKLGRLSLHAAPLDVGPLVERHLWHEKDSVIMTSATLTTTGQFDYIRKRLSAEDADELALGSPFDYETATLLYLVNDIAEPADRQMYQQAVEKAIVSTCKSTHGRALVLFTSIEQLRTTARAVTEPLTAAGIQVFEQSDGASRHTLLERFRASQGAVLLGTRSFWEGVDVPGQALSLLIIVRLPFDVPSDPIVAARSEAYESPFAEYSIPEAILRFRQGFGRLIRTKSDRGVVVILDRRVVSKAYGRAFVESVPRCTVRAGRLVDLPAAAARWLGS